MLEKAIVLASGGMYSAVAAAMVADRFERCMLFVDYRQRALARELAAFEQLCQHWSIEHSWRIQLTHFQQLGGSPLVDLKQPIHDAAGPQELRVPLLVPTLLNAAASFAFRIGANQIVTGISEAQEERPSSAKMLPDRGKAFLVDYQYLLDAALPPEQHITVQAPLMDYSRSEVIKLGRRLKVPFESTWSCYDGGDSPCERCWGCDQRARAFIASGAADPLVTPTTQAP